MILVSTTPASGATNIGLISTITVVFDTNIEPSSISDASIVVATKKKVIQTIKSTERDIQTIKNDSFFNPEFTGIVEGTVTIGTNPKELVFTPKFRLMPDTTYTVHISQSIEGTDNSLLGKIMGFPFTTAAEDIIEQIETPPVYSRVIGTTIVNESSDNSALTVVSANPANNSFMITDFYDKVEIEFNKTITLDDTKISIYCNDIFSDLPPTKILTATISADDKVLTIEDIDHTVKNKAYIIRIAKGAVTDSSGNTLSSDYILTYVTLLDPYYSSTKLVRLKAGTLLQLMTDMQLGLSIHYASLEADHRLAKIESRSEYTYLKEKYTLYNALNALLLNNFNLPIENSIKKQLAEFSLSINEGGKIRQYQAISNEVKGYLNSLDTLLAHANNVPRTVGSLRPDYRKEVARTWSRGMQPGLNTLDVSQHKMIFDEIVHPIPYESQGYYYNVWLSILYN